MNQKKLTYRQRQALATQTLIVDESRKLFLQQGYGATTMEAIAASAGVAVSTLYALFKNKRGILAAIREAWHQESRQRNIYQDALAQQDRARRFELVAHATRRQWESGVEMTTIYRSAAAVDPEAAAELQEALAGRRAHLARFINASQSMLRPMLSPVQATAILFALTLAEVYETLVIREGWTADEYEAWLATLLKSQLLGIETQE